MKTLIATVREATAETVSYLTYYVVMTYINMLMKLNIHQNWLGFSATYSRLLLLITAAITRISRDLINLRIIFVTQPCAFRERRGDFLS